MQSVEDRLKLPAVKYLATISQIIPEGSDKRSLLIKIKQPEYTCKYSRSLFSNLGWGLLTVEKTYFGFNCQKTMPIVIT